MKRPFSHFFLQLRRRNGEHEQAVLRIFFASLIFFYLLAEYLSGRTDHRAVLIFSAEWLLAGGLVFVAILLNGKTSVPRRFITMVADIGATTYGMLLTQENGALFFGVYLWVIVGNGLRYGIPALVSSYVLSIIGFTTVIVFNDYWSSNLRLSIGLMITLVLIPLYLIKLRNQLNYALENAKQANQAKSRFLAQMSHEMRTPLNGVVGVADLLTATPLNNEQRDLVNTLKNSSSILRQLIENVLDISKIESGKMVTEKVDFDLHELVNNAVELFMPQANAKGLHLHIRFSPDTAFALHGDALHLTQVLINLLGNAIKFTAKGSVELRIGTVRQSIADTRLRFEIIDTGIGIPAKAQPAIFERFRQADASIARLYGGTGLGTTISRDLVRLMDGEIGVHSEPGIGSTFWFELPLQKQAAALRAAAPTSLEQLRVIGFGFSPLERSVLATTLAGWKIRFEHEPSAQQLFYRLRSLPLSVQKSTVVMGSEPHLNMSAAEFARSALEGASEVSLMLLNLDAQAENGVDYLCAGYACVLRAPLDKALLFNALHGVMAPHPAAGAISFREHYERNLREREGVRILVADDNGTNRKIIARILEHGGHTVELAESGEQALDLLEQGRFDLMILDKNMPDMGGLEIIKIHRATSLRSAPVPAIILTADATTEALRECEAAAVEGYLTKPVDTIVLLDTIARLTSTRRKAELDEIPEPEGTNQAATADSTVLNEQTLHQLALIGQGQTNFLPLVIHGFIAETEKLLEAMQTALANREYATFKELAHMIKGSSGNIGAEALHQTCGRILSSNPAELQTRAPEWMDEARADFKSARMLLIQYLGDSSRLSM
ncbi:ATP-binding protein [Ferrigenium sp. UT5]|uniref:ATP-binding protein n=1 Tax=Ferrigenium sp. UT5 TaxID=3242105 RepID=UPI0035517A33